MKRTKIVAMVSTGILGLTLFLVGVWAAVVTNFSLGTNLSCINTYRNVYVELSGQIYRGLSYSELEPLLDDSAYTLEVCKNFTLDENGHVTIQSLPSWNPKEVYFSPDNNVIQFKFNVKNRGTKQISVIPTDDVEIPGVDVIEEAANVLAIPPAEEGEYRLTLFAHTTELNEVPFNLNFDIVNTEDISVSKEYFVMNSSIPTQLDSVGSNWKTARYGQRVFAVPESLGIETIAEGVFDINPTYCIFPNTLKALPESLCLNNKSIKAVAMPDGLDNIGEAAFSGCEKLTSVKLPKDLKTLSANVFNSTSLISIDLPAGLQTIGTSAFENTKLNDITIPSTVIEIAPCFANCTSLKYIKMNGNTLSSAYTLPTTLGKVWVTSGSASMPSSWTSNVVTSIPTFAGELYYHQQAAWEK